MKNIFYVIIAGLGISILTGCGGIVGKAIDRKLIKNYIRGIYDISTQNDIMYLNIDKSGRVDTYILNNNENCYFRNKNPGLNSEINGKDVKINYKHNYFNIDATYWYYDVKAKISKVTSNNLSSLDILETNNIRIATSKHLTSNITIGELNQSLCK